MLIEKNDDCNFVNRVVFIEMEISQLKPLTTLKWPSLRQLHYLITLYETRHFSDAAQICCVSQSTLSKGIQTLEQLIGCQLYEKKDKKRFIAV